MRGEKRDNPDGLKISRFAETWPIRLAAVNISVDRSESPLTAHRDQKEGRYGGPSIGDARLLTVSHADEFLANATITDISVLGRRANQPGKLNLLSVMTVWTKK